MKIIGYSIFITFSLCSGYLIAADFRYYKNFQIINLDAINGRNCIDKKVALLPNKISNIHDFKIYAENYLKDSSACMQISEPKFRFAFKDASPHEQRIWEIFDVMKGWDCAGIKKSHVNKRTLVAPLMSNEKISSKIIKFKYSNFLISNKVLENFDQESAKRFIAAVKELQVNFKKNVTIISKLSPQEIKKIFKVRGITEKDKQIILDVIVNEIDFKIDRLIYLFDYYANEDSTHMLDVYLLAEHTLDYIATVENLIKVAFNSPASWAKHFQKLMAHKDFPVRKLYFTLQAAGFHLFKAANEVREKAGLKPIDRGEIGDQDFVDKHLEINFSLPPISPCAPPDIPMIKSALRKKQPKKRANKQVPHVEVCEVSNVESPQTQAKIQIELVEEKKAEPEPTTQLEEEKKAEQEIEEEYFYKFIPWPSAPKPQVISASLPLKLSLSERVFSMLKPSYQKIFLDLFNLKDRALTQHQLNALSKKIAFCLISLGHAEMANQILSKAAHFYHPKEGKAGALPAIYLHYRLIPLVLSDIIPLGFDRKTVIEGSKILRSSPAFTHED